MPTKKISIPTKPNKNTKDAQKWIEQRKPPKRATKILIFRVPAELHQRVKLASVNAKTTISRVLTELVINHFGDK